MAKIGKPEGKPATTKITSPQKNKAEAKQVIPAVTSKPAPDILKPIQVNIPANLRKDFKLYAAEQEMTLSELFIAMYKEYREKHDSMIP